MTVQTLQEPGDYPTAPPWASPPVLEPPSPWGAALFGGAVPPYDSPDNKHGQLLVRFPGELHDANRPEAPSWFPVAVWTLFLSALGVVSALRRSATARRYGRPRRPYWVAFVTTLLAGAAFWSLLTVNVAVPLYERYQEARITTALQATLTADGRVTKKLGTVPGVACEPEGRRNAEGLRTYLCTFELSTGKSAGMYVEADSRGNWQEPE